MGKTIVVGKLYMVGCGHCETLEEPWNQMKKKVGGKIIVAGDIEAAETRELAELNDKHGSNVEMQDGYPTIYKIKSGGKVEYYNGERTASKLIGWALQGKQNNTLKGGRNKKQKRASRRNRTSKK
jgi:hypothetical protein